MIVRVVLELRYVEFGKSKVLIDGVGVSFSSGWFVLNASCFLEFVNEPTAVLPLTSWESGELFNTAESPSCRKSCTRELLLVFVGARCICRLIFPFSSIFRASGEASRRLPNVGTPVDLCRVGVFGRSFFTSMMVAFFESGIGMREAVFMDLGVAVVVDMLPGLGREKLAGDGLCVRDSVEAGDADSSLVKSVKVMTCCLEPTLGVMILPLEILLRSDAFRAGKSAVEDALLGVRCGQSAERSR